MTTEQSECLAEATKEIARFTEILHRRIHGQLRYDLEVNLPEARVKRQEMRTHALRSGIVSAIGEWLRWDSEQTNLQPLTLTSRFRANRGRLCHLAANAGLCQS
jgi:hypothetical protein